MREEEVGETVCVKRTWMCLSAWRGSGGVCLRGEDVDVYVCVERTWMCLCA